MKLHDRLICILCPVLIFLFMCCELTTDIDRHSEILRVAHGGADAVPRDPHAPHAAAHDVSAAAGDDGIAMSAKSAISIVVGMPLRTSIQHVELRLHYFLFNLFVCYLFNLCIFIYCTFTYYFFIFCVCFKPFLFLTKRSIVLYYCTFVHKTPKSYSNSTFLGWTVFHCFIIISYDSSDEHEALMFFFSHNVVFIGVVRTVAACNIHRVFFCTALSIY